MGNAIGSVHGFITVGDTELRYTVEGDGPPVLVVGSAVYYPRTFSQQIKAFCRLACCDLRHFAKSDRLARKTQIGMDTYVSDIENIRTMLGFEQFALVGHSHHGNVALEYAKRYPNKVSQLVLIGTPPCDVRSTIEEGQRYWKTQASGARKEALRQSHMVLAGKSCTAMSPDEAFVAEYVADGPKYWYDVDFDAAGVWQDVPVNMAVTRAFKGFFENYTFDLAPVNNLPVLVVMGKHDYVVPHTLWDKAASFPNVAYHLLEKSGHAPQLEEQAAFDEIFLAWLTGGQSQGSARA